MGFSVQAKLSLESFSRHLSYKSVSLSLRGHFRTFDNGKISAALFAASSCDAQ